jgi:hypothetical protein
MHACAPPLSYTLSPSNSAFGSYQPHFEFSLATVANGHNFGEASVETIFVTQRTLLDSPVRVALSVGAEF